MRSIAMVNQKGGVGKTTCTMNIAAGLARLGKRVLLIDTDPHAGLTKSFGISQRGLDANLYALLSGKANLDNCIMDLNAIKLIPASPRLSSADIEFIKNPGKERMLEEKLRGIGEFDFVILDCPPSLGFLTYNALTAAKEVFVPIQTTFLSLAAVVELMEIINLVKQRLNYMLEVTGVIINFYDQRELISRDVHEIVKEQFGDKVFKTMIRKNVSLAEAPGKYKTIFEYRLKSHGAEDFMKLCEEILSRS